MAEARETVIDTWEKFYDGLRRYMEEMTDDDWHKFNEKVRQNPELDNFIRENIGGTVSDDTSKQSNEVSEGVSESKIVENGGHEIKNDNGDTIENVAIERDNNGFNDNQVSNNCLLYTSRCV